jgi:DNA-binding transcriptional LysR family regulator|nr:LysR family transcriptional regulator [Kofleriaceae bacterium]
MRLAGIDLNLLTALEALLDESNVTRAARRLGVTQPAASHALARLRDLLGDPLLVRTPAGMQPTPHARELLPAARAALAAAEAVLQAAPAFDPATAERTFVATIPDQAGFQLLPRLVTRVAELAPGVRLEMRPAPADIGLALANGDLQLAVGVFRDPPPGPLRQQLLWREDFACVVRRGAPASRGPFDLARYLAVDHLLVAPRGTPGSLVDDVLSRAGHHRRIALVIPQFLIAPAIVAGSDLMWTAPAGLARAFADQLPLTVREPPLDLPGFQLSVRWHLRFDRDPGLAWLRGLLAEVAPRSRS